MKLLTLVSLGLIIIGGLNWGLVGFLNWDLVAAIFGAGSVLSRTVYAAVGLAALWQIGPLFASLRSDGAAVPHSHSAH